MELVALSAPWILLLLIVVAFGLLMFRRWKVATGLLLLTLLGNWWFEVYGLGFMERRMRRFMAMS